MSDKSPCLMLIVSVSDDLAGRLHAGRIAARIAESFGGRGGGSARRGEAGINLTVNSSTSRTTPQ